MESAINHYPEAPSVGLIKAKNSFLHPRILTGHAKTFYLFKMWVNISFYSIIRYPNPIHLFKIVKRLLEHKKHYTVNNSYNKLSYVDGRVHFSLNNNGWPSNHFIRPIAIEAKEAIHKNVSHFENLRMVLIAFTKKCPLFCEHCYEGPELNKKDTLSLEDHKKILKKLQKTGISLFHFGGGDPMSKVNELIELIDSAEKTADFWIYTSGFNFTEINALRLKQAGLTGVSISLDHHLPEYHNKFRRHTEAFNWVKLAAANALKVKLVITLSICVTREYCNTGNLFSYLELARELGASFIQLLEPRAVGNYAGKDVSLTSEHETILEHFFTEANTQTQYKLHPIVLYPAYFQRRSGCPGAGSKFLFIDTDGYMRSCPFCRNKKTHILDDDHEVSIQEMKNEGCGKYSTLY